MKDWIKDIKVGDKLNCIVCCGKGEKRKAVLEVVGETSKSWKIKTSNYSELFLKSDLSHNIPMRRKNLFTPYYCFTGIANQGD